MTDKKLTDNEIKKALECCASTKIGHCETCPLNDGMGFICISNLAELSLDLFNRLQARIEKCEKVEHFADKTIKTLQAENEMLKESNRLLINNPVLTWQDDLNNEIKAEAYKEFADRVKEKSFDIDIALGGRAYNIKVVTIGDIDNLLEKLEENECRDDG